MAKFIVKLKCTDRFCREDFRILVDEKYSNRRMKMFCPRCFAPLVLRIPVLKAPEAEKSAKQGVADELAEVENALSDIFKTGEELITGAHKSVKDVLGKLRRDIGAE